MTEQKQQLLSRFGANYPQAVWLWCDIDGHGPRWRLAIFRRGGDETEIYFPHDEFADDAEGYTDCPTVVCAQPTNIPKSE